VAHCTCAPGTSWCPRADELFGVEGVHALDASSRNDGVVVVDVETDVDLAVPAAALSRQATV
jgi:hypothetical protein